MREQMSPRHWCVEQMDRLLGSSTFDPRLPESVTGIYKTNGEITFPERHHAALCF